MNKENGFTLIELLAVIVILAIIALIATPLILGVIDDSRRDSLRVSADGVIKAGELYILKNLSGSNLKGSLFIEDLSTESILSYKGTKPSAGKLKISENGDVEIIFIEGKNCAYKTATDVDIKTDKVSSDNCDINNITNIVYETDIIKCLNYDIAGENATIIGFKDNHTCNPNKLILPDKIEDVDVTSIEEGAFKEVTTGKALIKLPKKLYQIGKQAFYGNNFEGSELLLPVTLYDVGEQAFMNSNINNLKFLNETYFGIHFGTESFANNNISGEFDVKYSSSMGFSEKAFYNNKIDRFYIDNNGHCQDSFVADDSFANNTMTGTDKADAKCVGGSDF